MIKCKACGKDIPPGKTFCGNCGRLLYPDEIEKANASDGSGKCPNCGREYSKGTLFCERCGHRIGTQDRPASEKTVTAPAPERTVTASATGRSAYGGAAETAPAAQSAEPYTAQPYAAPYPAAEQYPAPPPAPVYPDEPYRGAYPGNYTEPVTADPAAYDPAPVNTAPEAYCGTGAAAPKKRAKRGKTGLYIISGVVLALLVVLVFLVWNTFFRKDGGPKNIDFDFSEYVVIVYDGADGSGSATLGIDSRKLGSDLRGKIKYRSGSESGNAFNDFQKDLEKNIVFKKQYSDLLNGQEIEVEWKNSDDAEDKYNIRAVSTSKTFRVEGLEPVPSVDAFAIIKLGFSGTDGNGTASAWFTEPASYTSLVDIVCEPSENLSNGDTVTVRLSMKGSGGREWNDDDTRTIMSECGIRFKATSASCVIKDSLEEKEKTDKTILPESDVREIKEKEIKGFDIETSRYAIFEIYARYGVEFDDSAVQEYFDGIAWYENLHLSTSDIELNKFEKKNIDLLNDHIEKLRDEDDDEKDGDKDDNGDGGEEDRGDEDGRGDNGNSGGEEDRGKVYYVDSEDGLNLRAGPSVNDELITIMKDGSMFLVYDVSEDGKWYFGMYNGYYEGWCRASYLTEEGGEE